MSSGLHTPRVDRGIAVPSGTTPTVNGFVIPRTVHLPLTAPPTGGSPLPAASAFTTQAAFPIPLGTKRLTAYVVYTRGAANGFPMLRVLWGNGTEEGREVVIDQPSLVPMQPDAEFNTLMSEPLGPTPATAAAITYDYEFEVPGGATTFRLIAAELGVPATPGTMLITLTGASF